MKHKALIICIAVLSILLAIGITIYPLVSSAYNEQHQSQIHVSYQEKIEKTDTSALDEARERAITYNQALIPGILELEAYSQEALLHAAQDYENQLDIMGNGIMGYVVIPNIQIRLPIYHGTSDAILEQGVGHLLGSSLPVGGDSTHSILTAHSGMASQKLFSDLNQLTLGDVFYLDILGTRMAYEVDQINTVLPYDTTYLGIHEGEDFVTLVTCVPYGINTHRLLVRGTKIPYEQPEESPEDVPETTAEEVLPESTWEQEYIQGIYAGCAIAGIMLLVVLGVILVKRFQNGSMA